MSHQIENTNKEVETKKKFLIKRNQIGILELKSTISEIKNS